MAGVRDLGSPADRYRRAINGGNLPIAEAAMREMGRSTLSDALELVNLMAKESDPRFAHAAARWVARLTVERDLTVHESRRVLAMLEILPDVPAVIDRVRAASAEPT